MSNSTHHANKGVRIVRGGNMTIELKHAKYALNDIQRILHHAGQEEHSPYLPRPLTKEAQNTLQLTFIILQTFLDGIGEE